MAARESGESAAAPRPADRQLAAGAAMDGKSLRRDLAAAGFRGRMEPDVDLAPLTTWKIGGPVDLLASPTDRDDVRIALLWARARGVPWRILGNGSNLLIRELGVRGLVLRTKRALDDVEFDGCRVDVGAGASFPALAHAAAACGLGGIEFGAGIPGTLGGAIVMNAGWHQHEIGAVLESVEALDSHGVTRVFEREACAMGYRESRFRVPGSFILGARLRLVADDPAAVRARIVEYAEHRRATQPTELPSCGSVFLKPAGDFAGRLIEAAELKGLRIGDIEVSPKHANFFVNHGNASAAQVLELVERVERTVAERFGVQLVREFDLW